MKRLLIIAAVVIIISNAAVLARVHYNRSGEPQTISLTERELRLPYKYRRHRDENSALSLNLQWRTAEFESSDYYWHSSRDLTVSEQKLQQLGFRVPGSCDPIKVVKVARGGRDKSRPAWLVLEYDGPVHANYIQELEKFLRKRQKEIGNVSAEPEQEELKRLAGQLQASRRYHSRLYVVDVALSKEEMLKQYADKSRHMVFAAEISNASYCNKERREIRVGVEQVLPSTIYVPLRMHEFFEQLPGGWDRKAGEGPRYNVEIAIGKLNEPWLVGIKSLPLQGEG